MSASSEFQNLRTSKQLTHTGLAAIENVKTIDERRLKIVRNIVFDCHLSPDWQGGWFERAP